MARLTDQTAGARRLRPRLGLSPMVLSVSESGFVLRAFGVWKRYSVEGTIELAEFGSRVILEVNPMERAPALQAAAAGLLA